MTARVIEFPTGAPLTPPIAQFMRVGEAHRKIGELIGMDRFPVRRVVIPASRLSRQKRLIELLRPNGVELVLDTEVAELASEQHFRGHQRQAPWGVHCEHRPLGPMHFRPGAPSDVIGQIARTAVEYGFHVVLAPTHFLNDPGFKEWLAVDRLACLALRAALDREGGSHVRIDYPVLHAHTAFYRSEVRSELLGVLGDLPFDYLWIRASGTTGDGGPEVTKRFLGSLAGLHNSGKPLILDYLGGVLSQAAIAFGMASGRAHGLGEMERFDAHDWHKPPKEKEDGQSFGRTDRIAIPGLGRTLTKAEAMLLAKAHGGRRLVGCEDRTCCRHGVEDTFGEHRQHLVTQAMREVAALEAVPLLRRDDWFLKNTLAETVRRSRSIADLRPREADAVELKVDPTSLMKRLRDHARRMQKVETALTAFYEARSQDAPRARPAVLPRIDNEQRRQDRR